MKALNKESQPPKEGVSKVENTELYFDGLLKNHPRELVGGRQEFGVLVKAPDSAVRLPVQAHPDQAFSQKHLAASTAKRQHRWFWIPARAYISDPKTE